MLDFGGANAERQRAERAVRGGMRVAANHGHAGERGTLLRTDHVHDTLTGVVHAELGDAEVTAIRVQRLDLQARHRVGDALGAVGGRYVVVGGRKVGVHAPELARGQAQALEGLWARDLVHQVPVDIKQAGTVLVLANDMGIPELVVQRLSSHGRYRRLTCVNPKQVL